MKLDKRFVMQKRLSKKNIQKRSFIFLGFFHQKMPSLHQKNAFFLQNNFRIFIDNNEKLAYE